MFGVGGAGSGYPVHGVGDSTQPPVSDEGLVEVFAQIGIAIGQAGAVNKMDATQINKLIFNLQAIPATDPNYNVAQSVIGPLQNFITNKDVPDIKQAYNLLFNFVFPGGAAGPAAQFIDDQQFLEIAFGEVGLAKLDPANQTMYVKNALVCLNMLPPPWENPLIPQSTQALQQATPDIDTALKNLSQLAIP